ncbi:MAG TPA: hypothetical protein VNI52_06130 [Sphingobacteriaceae bacterium]|nr:hypothetical protein [Sphingobacteriaceae bacterium]
MQRSFRLVIQYNHLGRRSGDLTHYFTSYGSGSSGNEHTFTSNLLADNIIVNLDSFTFKKVFDLNCLDLFGIDLAVDPAVYRGYVSTLMSCSRQKSTTLFSKL